jgi:hypothetical protein
MPPQLPNNQQQNPRHRVVAVMTAAQEDALHQLRRDGVPELYALAVMQRISSLCLHTLRELDRVYREFEELLAADPDRSQTHQEWLDTKAGGVLLTLEASIAALVAEAINKAKEDYRNQLSQPQEGITLPPMPSRPGWLAAFFTTIRDLVWIAGMVSGFVLAWQFSGSFVVGGIGFLVPFLLWLKLGRFRWGLVFPLSGIGLEALALYWIAIVEGGLR